ncbi:MAG: RNA polymerase sigma factor RpoH [Gammaproteobacteria bacterium]|nr:MAG: RNA polymerase sigma factor RpoH [Gammaproteobacteria bacterium]
MSVSSLALKNPALVLAGPVGSLDAYIERVSSVPVLTREQELALARRFREHEDLDAARQLVLSHLRFVVHIARGYAGYGLPAADLIQEGNIGLMKAVKRFDPGLGVRLVSFAVHWIRAEIHEFVIRNWRMVRVATTKAQRKLFFNLRRMKRNLAWLSDEETHAVASELGVEPREVREMEQRLSARDLAFDPTPETDEEDGAWSPAHYLPAPEADPAVALEQEEWDGAVSEQLVQALGKLDERSRHIVNARWLAANKRTLQELADEYGVSAERIRQIEANALKKLKGALPFSGHDG